MEVLNSGMRLNNFRVIFTYKPFILKKYFPMNLFRVCYYIVYLTPQHSADTMKTANRSFRWFTLQPKTDPSLLWTFSVELIRSDEYCMNKGERGRMDGYMKIGGIK